MIPATAPSPRWDMAFSGPYPCLFGGRISATAYSNESWLWTVGQQTPNWRQLVPRTAAVPPPRAEAALASDLSLNQYLFGGRDGSQTFGDTWVGVADLSTTWGLTWAPILNGPSPRYGAAMTQDAHSLEIVLFGGRDSAGAFNDTWKLVSRAWQRIATTGAPPPRSHHALVGDQARRVLVLYGGVDANGQPLNDVWELSGTTWTARAPSGSPPPPRAGQRAAYFGADSETFVFDPLAPSQGLWRYGPVARGEWILFGVGCGNVFAPLRIGPQVITYPRLGEPWGVGAGSFHPAAPAVVYLLGTSTSAWGTLPLPASLARLGMPGCLLYVSVDASIVVPVVRGEAPLLFTIPNDLRLIAARLHWQALSIVPTATQWGTSNGLTMVIGTK
jgi:hypothetical protein